MVIAEGLNEIKDLEKARKQILDGLLESLFVLPDLGEAGGPPLLETQLTEIDELSKKIASLKVAITHTNLITFVEVAKPGTADTERLNLMQLLKQIEFLRTKEKMYTNIAQRIEAKDSRFFTAGHRFMAAATTEPIKLRSNFTGTVRSYKEAALKARKQARQYEQALVKTNWVTEVVF
jgi:hypothetical protein